MATIRHPATGFAIGDPEMAPLGPQELQDADRALDGALGSLILSASGWRTVFARDGEEGRGEVISPAHSIIAAVAASAFVRFLRERLGGRAPAVIIGMDTRPTGPAIADCASRAVLAEGGLLRYAFICAAPEIMALARHGGEQAEDSEEHLDGFIYISASHNPIGHNGIKFGLVDGGVLGGADAAGLIADFKERMAQGDRLADAVRLLAGAVPTRELARAYSEATLWKRRAISAYTLFSREVVTGSKDATAQNELLDRIQSSVAGSPLSVLIDFNGSARSAGIDLDFLAGVGIGSRVLNGSPREIAHRIVPEGSSLEPARQALELAHAEDPSFLLGYMPDCDGDRGNLVVWDDDLMRARALEAQEVFALCCVAELAQLVWTGRLRYDQKGNALDKVAVAVNDPTSMRIDRIAAAFDVDVFRAEVGEANVVSLARKLRDKGYGVRILGEGSAGGNITYPSAVRDPLATVFALIKLLTLRSEAGRPGLFELWCSLAGRMEAYRDDFTLADIVATLPAFRTTSVYEDDAVMSVKTADHGALKDRYQAIFLRSWEDRKKELAKRYGFVSWEAIAYLGTEERRGIAHFGDAGRGGLKVLFRDAGGKPKAFMWMRGSGTEPVFRILADAEGSDPRAERELLAWQRGLIEEADAAS